MSELETDPGVPETAIRQAHATGVRGRPSFYRQHDVGVLVLALAILAVSAGWYRSLHAPRLGTWTQEGLTVRYPKSWLPPEPVQLEPAQIALSVPATKEHQATSKHTHVAIHSRDPLARIEIEIGERPVYRNWRGALSLARVSRYGDTYWTKSSHLLDDGWLRTEYRYAFAEYAGDSPHVLTGVEYASLLGERLYRVTFHERTSARAEALAKRLVPTLVRSGEAQ